MKLASITLLAASVLFMGSAGTGANTSVKPKTADFCAQFVTCPWFGEHKLQGPSPGGYDGSEAHGDCRTCVDGYPCHSDCEPTREQPQIAQAYTNAVAAANRGDVETVLAHQSAAAGYVVINEIRNTVQVLSCDKRSVIANLPLGIRNAD